jgi:hypothetical protein
MTKEKTIGSVATDAGGIMSRSSIRNTISEKEKEQTVLVISKKGFPNAEIEITQILEN